jgi:hypothetical protein
VDLLFLENLEGGREMRGRKRERCMGRIVNNNHLRNRCRIEENKDECWDMGILMVVDLDHRMERNRIWSVWMNSSVNKENKNNK